MPPWTSRILAATLGLALVGLSGCVSERETTLSRTARQREIQAMRTAREQLEDERDILIRRRGELMLEIGEARRQSVEAAALLRATLAGLDHELRRLVVAEHDLEAARERAAAIERELAPLRALEQTLAQQEELRSAAEQRVQQLRAEVAEVEAAAAAARADLEPRLAALRAELEQAQQAEKAIADARAALQAAAKVLPPPAEKK